jgi:MFS family permease
MEAGWNSLSIYIKLLYLDFYFNIYLFEGWILKKMGHIHMMSIVLLSVGLRFVLYSLLVNPWWVLPIEILNGFTFGMFYSSMTSYAAIISPPGTEATMQGLAGGLFEGVGEFCFFFLSPTPW